MLSDGTALLTSVKCCVMNQLKIWTIIYTFFTFNCQCILDEDSYQRVCDCSPAAERGVSVYASEVLDCWYKYNGMVITGYRYNEDQTFFSPNPECFHYPGSILPNLFI